MVELFIIEVCLILAVVMIILGQRKLPHLGRTDSISINEYKKAISVLKEVNSKEGMME